VPIGTIIELAVAAVLLVGGVWLYRRRSGGERQGSQGAVFLLLIGAIMLIHGLGFLDYRPSAAELAR
jgi:uncharacterized protein YqgC (DUF456 family)